jgi:Predicted dehydrogenases and related proteins
MPTTANTHPLRVAIVGYGLAGSTFHAPIIAATPGMEVAAIVTSNAQRQASVRKHFPEATLYATTDELWKNAALYDLAVIAAVNATHVKLGIAAMRAGLPVVIDKPMAATVADAQRLLNTSTETGQKFSIYQNRRWDSDLLTVKKIIKADLLGTLTRFESRIERYQAQPKAGWKDSPDPQQAAGQLYDLGSHVIDQALYLFGQPERVYAEMSIRRPGAQVDDDTFIALHFPNDLITHLWVSQVARISGPRMLLRGLRGSFVKYGEDPQEAALRAGGRPGTPDWGKESPEFWGHIETDLQPGHIHLDGKIESEAGAYQNYYAQMRDAVLGKGPVPVDPHSTLEVIRVIEAAQQSASEHRVVNLQ